MGGTVAAGADSRLALVDDVTSSGAGAGVASGSTGASACDAAPAPGKFEVSAIITAAFSCISSPSPVDLNHLSGFTVGCYLYGGSSNSEITVVF
jgi:hypothetical protein